MYSRQHSLFLYLIPHASNVLLSCSYLDIILQILPARFLTRFYHDLAINLALLINFTLKDMFFVISSPFLLIILTSFSIEGEKLI